MQNTFFKKLIALTLAGCFALSSFPSIAFSDETEEMLIEVTAGGTDR